MATTTNYGWTTPDDTALVKDGASAIRSLGTSVDTTTKNLNPETTLGDIAYRSATSNTNTRLAIGSSGQALTVVSGVPSWAASATSTLTAKGDILTATAANTLARLGVGTNNQYLVADSTAATGLKWATLPSSGKVLQVVQMTTSTLTSIATGTYTDSGLSLSITPSATTSKILVIADCNTQQSRAGTSLNGYARIVRTSTTIYDTHIFEMQVDGATGSIATGSHNTLVYLDSPSTTSATTYKVQGSASTGATLRFQYTSAASSLTLIEIGA